ncbi:50S ribosomal protein L20 [Candidatus Campbellbacteria bacterium RIFCSPLOWO2_02_35_12]|uniref:Large ribosomal subunit protein bL20 n=1 Tax=Candidatus Campbellbacteria bacterium RIFCSPLOWO2_02_35_12 TaxID=1797580 RepID=A0A1F5EFJ0_9BACT|nr:MAG: 50S ribosomal protein L20 [Candidatus Campbellbacteria bacterium RIFCSPLOWO2_02_35_12]
MSRVKRGTTALKRRKNILKKTKGYRFGRSTKKRQAKEALAHAGAHSFAHRRDKKNDFRRLWNIKINAFVRANEKKSISYSKFISALKKNKINLDRKILADLAENNPQSFERILNKIN